MIARIWHGETPAAKGDDYLRFLQTKGTADYRATPGNRGVRILRRSVGEHADFLVISYWDSWEAVGRFAGPDVAKAVYYPEDQDFLLAFEPAVAHYEVFNVAVGDADA